MTRETQENVTRCDVPRMNVITRCSVGLCLLVLVSFIALNPSHASRPLVIVTSPSVKEAIQALGQAFEHAHPDVRVLVAVDTALELRRTIAGMENTGEFFIETGPIHLVAPGGDEVITRLEQKYYVLPEAKALYATEQLVLVAPESLTAAPESFEALAIMETVRIAVADHSTRLGEETDRLLTALRLKSKRLDVASNQAGILDHVLSGHADVGILFGQDAVRVQQRVRVVATARPSLYKPITHSIAMERYCPDRALCEEFLQFVTSPDGQSVLKRLGYGPGKQPDKPLSISRPSSR